MMIKFVCWFSKHLWDIHDWQINYGGNDTHWHWYTYTCWNCGKEFEI